VNGVTERWSARSTWHHDRVGRPGVLLGDVLPGPRGIVAGRSYFLLVLMLVLLDMSVE
jgi:hypothetical protein